jgi:hypothetical protein
MSDFLQTIQERRAQHFRPGPPEGIQTPEEALQFINSMGFCLFSYIPEFELPSLARAVCQDPQPDTWGWKDSLPAARLVYYGAFFHPAPRWAARPGFISLSMLAPLYSLAPILQFGGDREMLRKYMRLSPEAVAISEALETAGSLSTGELRASTGLTGKANASRFSRALAEAQEQFLITKIGVTSVSRANYGYIWNTFERVFPEAARQAEELPETDAAAAIILQYARTALAVPLARIGEVLSINPRALQPAANRLLEQNVLRQVDDEGICYLVND